MTWEETILMINKDLKYSNLVKNAYISTDLVKNVDNFKSSLEFEETLKLIKHYSSNGKKILDIGCGNGISSISFAFEGFDVTCLEPDSSNFVGYGAVKKLSEYYNLSNVRIEKSRAEDFSWSEDEFDIIYARQSLHHASNLKDFIRNTSKYLKKGGLWISVRDHVIFDEQDKKLFLESHELQKFYGGENAFTSDEYRGSLIASGLEIKQELKYCDSVINYFPLSEADFLIRRNKIIKERKNSLRQKIGFFSRIGILFSLYDKLLDIKNGSGFEEKLIPGRMYSYIALKK